ncbi:hypothetical protein [Methylobacterium phyllosphaerae]|uniref:hypothetical protein n=1 Tax=Methylobacterium phyllosphaerae TaxID=418223 RepID=UPI00094CCFCF|nr:hypothetical protein [Methylobacterium phyllosphaerae]
MLAGATHLRIICPRAAAQFRNEIFLLLRTCGMRSIFKSSTCRLISLLPSGEGRQPHRAFFRYAGLLLNASCLRLAVPFCGPPRELTVHL